jgi:hypothetical protein
MRSAAQGAGESVWRFLSAAAVAIASFIAMLLLILATLAVTFLGVLIAAGALAARVATGGWRRAAGPQVLEARRTADGWAVEPAPRA